MEQEIVEFRLFIQQLNQPLRMESTPGIYYTYPDKAQFTTSAIDTPSGKTSKQK